LTFFGTNAIAQTLQGTQLEIGAAGSDQVPSSTVAGAIGTFNAVQSTNSLAVGQNQNLLSTVSEPSLNLFSVGSSNLIGTGNSGSGTFGSGNSLHKGINTFLFGSSNIANGVSLAALHRPLASFATGSGNRLTNRVEAGFIAGSNNELLGLEPVSGAITPLVSASALGQGIINFWNHSTILGLFNDTTPDRTSGLLFAVGNGTTPSARSNVLEVYDSGKIVLRHPQGDIPMGQFGN
jgi:hypothetical protein